MASDSHPVLRRSGGKGWLGLAADLEGLGRSLGLLGENLLVHGDFGSSPRLVLGPQIRQSAVEAFSLSLEAWLGSPARCYLLVDSMVSGWAGSGLVVLAGGAVADWVRALSRCSADEILVEGSTVLAVGSAAAALGQWIFAAGARTPTAGLSWLPRAIVLSDLEAPAAPEAVHAFLAHELYSYAVSLPVEGALALGPAGEVEVWSREAPTVILGVGWRLV